MNAHEDTKPPPAPNYLLVVLITGLTVALDQISKHYILSYFLPGEIRPVIPDLFNLTLTFNPGAAFGLWRDIPDGWRQVVLGVTTCAALGVVFYLLKQPGYQSRLTQTALAGILGGAIGNIIDRLRHNGTVVDFLDVFWGSYHWPAFNIADSAICLGVALLIVLPYRKE
jgi:signal peptidase II